MSVSMILHLPHASTLIPEDLRNDFLLSDQELQEELNRITDHATDLIFQPAFPEANQCYSPLQGRWSPERFLEDFQEPMNQVGMGVTYTRGSLRQPLREQLTQGKRQELLERYYIPPSPKTDRGSGGVTLG